MKAFLLTVLLTTSALGQRSIVPARPDASGRRLALVIGNNDYPASPLKNPVNDASDLGKVLRDLGFDTDIVLNVTFEKMEQAVLRFASNIRKGDSALFYYAGHGMRVQGQNYLLPVNFDATFETQVKHRALAATEVRDLMQERGARLSIMILDACRNNPFRAWQRSSGGGLVGMSGAGAFIAFAADEGKTASDNQGERNGLFTKHLLTALNEPGLKIGDVFDKVREAVHEESQGTQVPFVYSGLLGRFYFRDVNSLLQQSGTSAPPRSVSVQRSEIATTLALPQESTETKLPDKPAAPTEIPVRQPASAPGRATCSINNEGIVTSDSPGTIQLRVEGTPQGIEIPFTNAGYQPVEFPCSGGERQYHMGIRIGRKLHGPCMGKVWIGPTGSRLKVEFLKSGFSHFASADFGTSSPDFTEGTDTRGWLRDRADRERR